MSASSIASVSNAQAASGRIGPNPKDRPDNPQEAAKQFEEMLVKQFVQVMTKGLYKSTMSGENGPSWMKGQRDSQRDILNDILTDHIVDSGVLGIRERMMKQWSAEGAAPNPATLEQAPAPNPAPTDAPVNLPDPAGSSPSTLGILNLREPADNQHS